MPLKVKSKVISAAKKAKPPSRVTSRYKKSTVDKLDKSILLAKLRYLENKPELSSSNYRVVRSDIERPENDEVLCSIKVGKRKWRILEDEAGLLVDQIKIAGKDVLGELQGFRDFVDSLDPGSDDEDEFNKLAIEQAWPPRDRNEKKIYYYDESEDLILKK